MLYNITTIYEHLSVAPRGLGEGGARAEAVRAHHKEEELAQLQRRSRAAPQRLVRERHRGTGGRAESALAHAYVA